MCDVQESYTTFLSELRDAIEAVSNKCDVWVGVDINEVSQFKRTLTIF
jgi:hypothetical protein